MRNDILLVLFLAGNVAAAADWFSLGKTDEGTHEIFLDRSSIRITGHIRRVWIKTVYAPQTMRGNGANANRWQQESLDRWAFDCGEETVRLDGAIDYFEDGTSFSVPL